VRRRSFNFSEALSGFWRTGADTSVTWRSLLPLISLVALIGCDLLFVAADVLYRSGLLQDARFDVTRERGFGEMFQYLKFAAAGSALFLRYKRARSVAAGILGFLFFYLLTDDALGLHERAGVSIGARLELSPLGALRPADFGEVIYFATIAVLVLGALSFLLWLGAAGDRRMIFTLEAGLAMLAVPAVGVDLVQSAVREPRLHMMLGILEDGGEMIAASALLAAALIFVPSASPVVIRRAEFDEERISGSVRRV
jgi:hypothetical protein